MSTAMANGEDEFARRLLKAYRFDHHLQGYALLGLRGWDDFIVINSSGVMFTIPTLPLDASYAAPFALPQQISLEPDERFAGKIKWYTKPLVFGGDAADKTNFAWITHEQHAELVTWWSEQYRSTKTQN